MSIRPQVGGFPVLAETLREAGVMKNLWSLPSCQSIYVTKFGDVVQQGTSLVLGEGDIPVFDRDALIRTLRVDQAGQSSFPEFLMATWRAGVISYVVDFENRTCTYFGARGDSYVERYEAPQS